MNIKRIAFRAVFALIGAILGLVVVTNTPIFPKEQTSFTVEEFLPGMFIGLLAGILLPSPAQLRDKRQSLVRISLLLLAASVIAWVFYFPLPNVVGLSYKEARAEMLKAGWKPHELKREGWWPKEYTEVISCFADAPICGSAFRRYSFQCLTISTDHEFSKVYAINRTCYE